MSKQVYECGCSECLRSKDNPAWQLHHRMNVFLSRLDEQQSRWYVALESQKIGHGGDTLLSQITGMNVETIRRGRQELDKELNERSTEHIRTAGGGQPSAEKKTHSSRRH